MMNELRSKIQERITILRSCILRDGPIDRLDNHFLNEIGFLENLLKILDSSQ